MIRNTITTHPSESYWVELTIELSPNGGRLNIASGLAEDDLPLNEQGIDLTPTYLEGLGHQLLAVAAVARENRNRGQD